MASATVSARYDGTAPVVTISGVPAQIDVDEVPSFTATFSFSEAVTGFEANDIRVSGGTSSAFAASGTAWTATIHPSTDSHELRITVVAGAVRDAAGNANEAATVVVDLLTLDSPDRQQAAHNSILPDLTQTVVGNITSTITGRIETAASAATPSLTIGGSRLDLPGLQAGGVKTFLGDTLPALIANNKQALEDRQLDAKALLAGTQFALPLVARADGDDGSTNTGLASVALWGGGNYRSLESEGDNTIDWSGKAVTASLGLDISPTANLLTGIAVSWTQAKLDYTDKRVDATGRYEYDLTSVSPYLGYNASDSLDIWLAAAFGEGETTLINADDGSRINSSDVSMQNVSGGLKLRLLGNTSGKLSLRTDVSHSQTELDNDGSGAALEVDKQRARLSLQAEQTLTLDSGTFTPSAEVGARYDGGDGNTGTGVEVGAGFTAAFSNGVQISFNTRGLLQSSANYRDLELNGTIRYQSRSKQGWSFSFEPRYGELNAGGLEQLWEQGLQTPAATTDTGLTWRSELGYGFKPRRGRQWSYYGGMEADLDSSKVHIGSRLQCTEAIRLELEIRRRDEAQRNNTGNEFLLKGEFNF